MADLSGFPSAEIQFRADGSVDGSDSAARALAVDPTVTDLLVLTHGWNNDVAGARDLFTQLARSLRAVTDDGHGLAPGRKLGILGVIWPSRQFALPEQMAGVAAAAGSPITQQDLLDAIDGLRAVFPDEQATLDKAAALVPHLTDKASARRAFVELVRGLLAPDPGDPAEGPAALFTLPGDVVLDRLAVPAPIGPPGGVGHAAAVGGLLGGILGAGLNLLNYATFYAMKERSAIVGVAGLAPLLTAIARPGLRLHLAGHSFGARLVSAAVKALPAGVAVASVALLQGAFSHFGFAADWDPDAPGAQPGFFRSDLAEPRVTGPVLVTHTANDLAVGIAYAVASRLANQVAAGIGGPDDRYGGIGRNGAQRTAEAVPGTLLAVGGAYAWQPRRPHNLLADAFVANHSDVKGREVAYAVLSAAATT
jgi:hypothetical protein